MRNVRLRVEIFENIHSRLCHGTPPGSVWCTGDRLKGQVVVTGPPDLQFGELAVSFLGMFRHKERRLSQLRD